MTPPPVPLSPPAAIGDGRLVAVDLLRGAAAVAVVVTHTPRSAPTGFDLRALATLPLDFGMLGLQLFIVLSGFCIHHGYARRFAAGRTGGWSWAAFWRRRFFRLYPPYVAAVALSLVVVYGLTPPAERPPELPADVVGDVVSHLLMVHNLSPDYTGGVGNAALWSLGLEEQLYGLFAVVVLLRARLSARVVLGIGLAVSVLWVAASVWVPFLLTRYAGWPPGGVIELGRIRIGHWGSWPFGWWFLWLIGAVAAEAHVGLVRVPAWLMSRWVIAATVAVTAVTNYRTLGRYARNWLSDAGDGGWLRSGLLTVVGLSDLVFAVGCFALLLRLIRAERQGGLTSPAARWTARLGLISYSLYLIHMPVLLLLAPLLGTPGEAASIAAAVVGGVAASIAFAIPFFFVFERPFLRRR